MYGEFFTQTPIGILEFSDQPMHDIPEADQHYGFFRAEHVANYLEGYCQSHVYGGSSIASRIKFESQVRKVIKTEDAQHWIIRYSNGNCEVDIMTTHLIDASGLTSTPNMPSLPDQSLFQGRIIHHKDFGRFEKDMGNTANPRVIVIGGAKSAADIAYSCAKKGNKVTWIVRKTGSGPAAFVSPKGTLGYANSNESFYTRFTSLFLASVFAPANGYVKLHQWLQKTWCGQALLRRIWRRIDASTHKVANYNRVDGRENGFRNLKPDTEIFWQNDSTGINQREDFFDTIAQQVKVFREDIAGMSKTGAVLSDDEGTRVDADVIIFATGWDVHAPYFDAEKAESLGLPVRNHSSSTHGSNTTLQNALEEDGEDAILKELPILDSPWAHSQTGWQREELSMRLPWRLWKSIVPPTDPTIAFVGRVMLGNHFRAAEVQALFVCAVLDGCLTLPCQHTMYTDIAKVVSWCRRRYLMKGRSGNWFYWDLIPYTDMLLETLGLTSHRQKAWYRDLFKPCVARDLEGLIKEYKQKSRT